MVARVQILRSPQMHDHSNDGDNEAGKKISQFHFRFLSFYTSLSNVVFFSYPVLVFLSLSIIGTPGDFSIYFVVLNFFTNQNFGFILFCYYFGNTQNIYSNNKHI